MFLKLNCPCKLGNINFLSYTPVGSVKLGKLSPQQAKMVLSNLKPSLSYKDVSDVDFVSIIYL